MSLHDQIMNLRCDADGQELQNRLPYKTGHRDARHAAAELSLQADSERDELLALLRKARDEFNGLPRSLGYEFTHLPEIEAALDKRELVSG